MVRLKSDDVKSGREVCFRTRITIRVTRYLWKRAPCSHSNQDQHIIRQGTQMSNCPNQGVKKSTTLLALTYPDTCLIKYGVFHRVFRMVLHALKNVVGVN